MLTQHELAEVTSLASELGLTREAAEQAHRSYLQQLAAVAWRDEKVTESERADLLAVARLLGVTAEEADATLQRAQHEPASSGVDLLAGALHAGDRVALTGEMSLPRSEIEAQARSAGLRVTGSVSARTAVLVTADPYSQSGKAKTARARGVRIVTEQVFLYLLENIEPARTPAQTRTPGV